jgi:uncharacterized protein (TIGR03435 family)
VRAAVNDKNGGQQPSRRSGAMARREGGRTARPTIDEIAGHHQKTMTIIWTKRKSIVLLAVMTLVVAGLIPWAVKVHREHRRWMWRVQDPTPELIWKATPQVTIVRTKFQGIRWVNATNGFVGIAQPASIVVASAYGMWATRLIENTPLPVGKYDLIVNLPENRMEAFRNEVKKLFGVVAHRETRPTDVLLLQVKTPDAPGWVRSRPGIEFSERQANGEYIWTGAWAGRLEGLLGFYFEKPVINQTGLYGPYDFRLKLDWKKRDPAAVKRDLQESLGLELVPAKQPIEVLVVEKAKD